MKDDGLDDVEVYLRPATDEEEAELQAEGFEPGDGAGDYWTDNPRRLEAYRSIDGPISPPEFGPEAEAGALIDRVWMYLEGDDGDEDVEE